MSSHPLALRLFHVLLLSALAGLGLGACAFSDQASGYSQSPVCAQQERKCKEYARVRKQAGEKNAAMLELQREDCEASQRACAESVRNLQEPVYPGDAPARSWRDVMFR
jgi:hypothetical protein